MQPVSQNAIKDDLFTHTLFALIHKLEIILKDITVMFQDSWIVPMCNQYVYKNMEQNDIFGEFQLVLVNDEIKHWFKCLL